MRYTICLAVLALASTAAAQNNQFSVSGVALLPGAEETYDIFDEQSRTTGSEPGFGVMLRYERFVGPWSIGVMYEHHRQKEHWGESSAMHMPALWMRLRAGNKVGFSWGLQFGAVKGTRQGFYEDGLTGMHAGSVFGIDARFGHVGLMIEAGYQFALLKSTDYLGNEADGHTHTPIIRVGLTFHI